MKRWERVASSALDRIPPGAKTKVKERLARAAGLPWDELARLDVERVGRPDLDAQATAILERVRPYTLTPPDRVAALVGAVDYLVDHDVPGDFVECGVWKGGSLMAAALRLRHRGATDRELYAFDTYTGMTDPTEEDVDHAGRRHEPQGPDAQLPVDADEAAVRRNLDSTGYPAERIHTVAGDVAETIPGRAPEQIALLRLDTDFYESTKHELEQLWPRLAVGGVLVIDDYGHFRGARKATDDYFADTQVFLQRVDYTARMAVKLR